MDNAAWTKANCTVLANQTASPSGYVDADEVTTTSTSHALFAGATVTASTAYTFSFYVKRGTMTDLAYRVFNLTAGTDIVAPTSYYSQTTASGWSRVTLTFTTPVGCTSVRVYPISNSGVTGTVYLWGAQLEAGAYVTSYVKTEAAAVTRVIDRFTKLSISSLINSQEGTLFVEMSALDSLMGTSILSLSDGTANNNLYIGYTATTNQISAVFSSGGVAQAVFNTTAFNVTQSNKIAVSYKVNDIKMYVNGTLVGSDTNANVPAAGTLNEFSSDFGQNSFPLAANISQALIFPTALTPAQLAELTTL
jgi:hypothetical protein